MIEVKILKDSLHPFHLQNDLSRLITIQVKYPRMYHSEVLTHRILSKNFSSSRAIPFLKMLKKVRDTPAIPIRFGANQSGMVMKETSCDDPEQAEVIWMTALREATNRANQLHLLNTHKTLCNRLIEPFQHIEGVITGEMSGWLTFLRLRLNTDADENIQELAKAIHKAIKASRPTINDWHLPFTDHEEYERIPLDVLKKVSVARCARVSYINHGKADRSLEDDIILYERLASSGHFSPFEHVNSAYKTDRHTNFQFWQQLRVEVDSITKNTDCLLALYDKFFK